MSKEEVKTSKKIKNFYLTIYTYLKKEHNPFEICNDYDISKQRLEYYIKKLKKQGLISKIGYATWQFTIKGKKIEFWHKLARSKKRSKKSSLGTRARKPITNLHALQINFPIISGKIKGKEWEIKETLNNWIPKYKELINLGGLTLKNNNNKSLTVFAQARDIQNVGEVDNLAFKIRTFIYDHFKKQGVIVDVFNAETKNLNLATEDKKAESMLRKGEKFELDLQKKAEKIFQQDKIHAKAWIDGSPFKFSAETNDKEWKREYLSMPFRILTMFSLLERMTDNMGQFNQNIAFIAENYKSHAGMVKEGHKIFKKLNKLLSKRQSRLGEFF